MSARDHSAGREIAQAADDCLYEGGAVHFYMRGRKDPLPVTRLILNQFTVRMFTDSGASYDIAYSAIEGVKYTRASRVNAANC